MSLVDLLKANSRVDDYKINVNDAESYELFFVLGKLETVRKTQTKDTAITVYVDHDGCRGNSTFRIFTSDSENDIRGKISDATHKALLVNDAHYTLPQNGTEHVEIPSNLSSMPMHEVAGLVGKAIEEASVGISSRINALEVFVKKNINTITNSRGIHKVQVSHSLFVEAIPSYDGEKEEVELYKSYSFSNLDIDNLCAKAKAAMQEVTARYSATKPQELVQCPVLLRSAELRELVWEIADQAGFGTVYMRSNLLALGDRWQSDPQGDTLTIGLTDVVEGSPVNARFDIDGTTLVPCTIVKAGKLVSYHGGNRFAQYMGEPATGILPIVTVEGGAQPLSHIATGTYMECVGMSGLQVDVYNDYIGGEVRLAYLYQDGVCTPITGISISAKLSEVLNHLRLSRECAVDGSYYGPVAALLDGFKIY